MGTAVSTCCFSDGQSDETKIGLESLPTASNSEASFPVEEETLQDPQAGILEEDQQKAATKIQAALRGRSARNTTADKKRDKQRAFSPETIDEEKNPLPEPEVVAQEVKAEPVKETPAKILPPSPPPYDPASFLRKATGAGYQIEKFSRGGKKAPRTLKLTQNNSVIQIKQKMYPLSDLAQAVSVGNETLQNASLDNNQKKLALILKHKVRNIVLVCATAEEKKELLDGLTHLTSSR